MIDKNPNKPSRLGKMIDKNPNKPSRRTPHENHNGEKRLKKTQRGWQEPNPYADPDTQSFIVEEKEPELNKNIYEGGEHEDGRPIFKENEKAWKRDVEMNKNRGNKKKLWLKSEQKEERIAVI